MLAYLIYIKTIAKRVLTLLITLPLSCVCVAIYHPAMDNSLVSDRMNTFTLLNCKYLTHTTSIYNGRSKLLCLLSKRSEIVMYNIKRAGWLTKRTFFWHLLS